MWSSDLRPLVRSAAGTVARGFQRGVPFGLLGLFQQHEVMRLGNIVQERGQSNLFELPSRRQYSGRKSPNRLWLFREEKPRARSGRSVGDCAGDNPGDVITCDHATVCILSRGDDYADNRSNRCADDSEWIGRRSYGRQLSTPQSLFARYHRYQDRYRPVRATR